MNTPRACNGDVLKPFCNRAECLRRKFGIGAGRVQGPIIGVRKINYRPNPIWFAQFPDGRELEINDANALLKQSDFAKLCLVQLNHFHHKIKAADWDNHISHLMDIIVIEEPEGDADAFGQLMTYFLEYVRSRKTDEQRGIATGQVFVFNGGDCSPMQFRLHHFLQYLKKQGYRDLRSERVHHFLNSLGARSQSFDHKGQKIATLVMPYPEHDDEEELDVPDYEAEEDY